EQEMRQAEDRVMQPVLERLRKVLDRLAKDRGYDLILDVKTPGVIYSSSAIDITDAVVAAYDAEARQPRK
ncbi:OmpH family outer membrane protein, partial [Dissulfurirhabdus thermomarina]